MKEKEPMMDIDEIEEVDIENMSMEELREFIAAAEAEVILQSNGSPWQHCNYIEILSVNTILV